MKQILLVDDDAVIVEIYRRKFQAAGFGVVAAEDGLVAMKLLSTAAKPDLVVLDLMMPKFSGVDVLNFIRGRPELKPIPVILFSNCYMSDTVQAAAVAGADQALLKSRCPPALLVDIVKEMLSGEPGRESNDILASAADYAQTVVAATSDPAASAEAFSEPDGEPAKETSSSRTPSPSQNKLRAEFLAQSPVIMKAVRALLEGFLAATEPTKQLIRLVELYRKLHFLTSMAAIANCEDLTQFASVLEAMLFELQEKPDHLTPSTIQTITQSVEFLERLFGHVDQVTAGELGAAHVLVVDDDVISNRLMVAALHRAKLKAASESNPIAALKRLSEKKYDLVLLDVIMPELDGFEVCARLRKLPTYEATPVIFVTSHADFETRSRSIISGGNDVIGKPILPIELAVKAVTHLLRTRLSARAK